MSTEIVRAIKSPALQRIKVAHVALSLELGGAEKLLVEFARHADRRRFDLQFYALSRDGVIGDQLRATGCRVTVLNCPDGLRPSLLFRLARHFRQHKPDIVHTHLDRPHIYGTVAARLAGTSHVIHTRHGQSDDLSPRQRRLVRFIARWTNCFVCVSRDAEQNSARHHGIPPKQLQTIWNGVDLARFSAAPINVDGPIVVVARLTPEKDIETLLRATALAAKHDRSLQVEIAGDGPCRTPLMLLAQQLGIDDRVRFLGAVDGVAELLSRAGMFVLPSRTEGISLALLEAQARNVPVIATHVGGTIEIISDGENGLLVPPGDAPALARAILRLRGDTRLCERLGAAARERMQADFDVTAMVRRYESLYESLTSGAL